MKQVNKDDDKDDNGEENDMDYARRAIDDEFTNIKAISANRGTTITGVVLGLFPTAIFAYFYGARVARARVNMNLNRIGTTQSSASTIRRDNLWPAWSGS